MTIKVINYANLICKPKKPNGLVLSQQSLNPATFTGNILNNTANSNGFAGMAFTAHGFTGDIANNTANSNGRLDASIGNGIDYELSATASTGAY